MAKGRPPKPTKLKILHGEKNKDRINREEPQPRLGIPSCPSHLNTPARAEWKRIVPELDRCGLLTHADRSVLAAYCQAYGEWVEVARMIKKDRMEMRKAETPDDATTRMKNILGLVRLQRDLMSSVEKMGTQMGLSPAARTKISLPEVGEQGSKFEQLLD